ncbi:cupin domain-containing protein [Bacillus sp. OK048]|uniref:cupin domain-containing protein n=1 Tax=Bacillus sp. OK048 TaxID=1882761 RepID=UPI00087FC82E|nr:cupin domain-containing protein [Bacillus sp. OK048]SDL95722.1 Cupin domain protein [Bacillus sp. OK048]
MKVIKANEMKLDNMNTKLFTGEVKCGFLLSADESKEYTMLMVSFPKGVRNKFHTHSSDQILIITAGEGIVATEDEEWTVNVGDIVYIPAGLKHWHGAHTESNFSHLSIYHAENKSTQLED